MRPALTRIATLLALAAAATGIERARAQAIFTTVPSSFSRLSPSPAQQSAPQPTIPQAAAPMLVPAPAPVPMQAQASPSFTPAPAPMQVPAPASAWVPPPFAAETPSPLLGARSLGNEDDTSLRHLTNNIQGFRLAGEIGTSEWPVFLTGTQAKQRLRFQVGYLTAVSVMPESSYLTLIVNDAVVGRVNLRATQQVRTVMFDVPAGLMQAGFNSVRLSAEQRHRVDCSIQATYELWTQIDPSKTGLLLPRATTGVSSLAELASLSPDAQGALPIRAVVPGRTSLANVERIIRVAQMISLVGRFEQPVVDIGSLADGQYGLNLVIGTTSEIAGLAGLPPMGGTMGPRVFVLPPTSQRRTTVVVTGLTDAEVTQALGQFDPDSALVGTTAGTRAAAAFPGYRIQGGQRVALKQLGVVSEEFGGRLFRAAFNVIMPPDFYPADYAKATLDLAGGYAAGLTTEAQMVVSVNGRNAVSRKLPKSGGDVFTNAPVPLPLSAMRPGLNRVEIEAQVPTASDVACDPLASIGGTNRFLFLDTTELEVPKIARIARMPDLAVTMTGGFPYAGVGSRPRLIVPSPDRESIGAATTLAAQMAIAAGQPIDFALSATIPEGSSGSTLIVAPARGLDPEYFRLAGLVPEDVVAAWSNRYEERVDPSRDEVLTRFEQAARDRLIMQRNFPASCRMAKPVGGYEHADRTAWRRGIDMTATASLPSGPVSGKLYEDWSSKLSARTSVSKNFTGYFDSVRFWVDARWYRTLDFASNLFVSKTYSSKIPSRASLVVAQSMLGDTRDDVVTLITAPNASALAGAVACLVDPRVWQTVSGRLSFLDATEGSVTGVPADDPRLIVTEPLTLGNTRLIAAGWLSLNAHIYVGLALAAAMLLALSTTLFVQGVGRRN